MLVCCSCVKMGDRVMWHMGKGGTWAMGHMSDGDMDITSLILQGSLPCFDSR